MLRPLSRAARGDAADLTKSQCVKQGRKGEACPCADELACVSDVCVAYSASLCE